MRAVTVTIGRNVGDVPLPAERWNEFVSRTRAVVEQSTDDLWAVAPYRGSWDGVSEDAVLFYGSVGSDEVTTSLREALRNLASYYDQEAVGLAIGDSELVEAFDRELVEAI